MSRNHWHTCNLCGERGRTQTHRCPDPIERDDWADVSGVRRFVTFPCHHCGEITSSDSVLPDCEPANDFGVLRTDCDHCGKALVVRLFDWPRKITASSRGYTGRRSITYGT